MVSLGFLKFIFGFEIDVCISFVAHLIKLIRKEIKIKSLLSGFPDKGRPC